MGFSLRKSEKRGLAFYFRQEQKESAIPMIQMHAGSSHAIHSRWKCGVVHGFARPSSDRIGVRESAGKNNCWRLHSFATQEKPAVADSAPIYRDLPKANTVHRLRGKAGDCRAQTSTGPLCPRDCEAPLRRCSIGSEFAIPFVGKGDRCDFAHPSVRGRWSITGETVPGEGVFAHGRRPYH
jgi:hypothetical protein